jgi:hypothetical protein
MKFPGLILVILLTLGSWLPVKGQVDSVKKFATESLDYETLNEQFKERKSMLFFAGRASMADPNGESFNDNGLYVGYEKKIMKYHVVGAGAGIFLNVDSRYSGLGKLVKFDVSYKWLYNLEYRMARGKTGNNLSANYFTLSPTVSLGRSPYNVSGYSWDFTRGEWAVKYESKSLANLDWKIGYGIQRTLGKRIHFDIQAGIMARGLPPFHSSNISLYGQITGGYIFK